MKHTCCKPAAGDGWLNLRVAQRFSAAPPYPFSPPHPSHKALHTSELKALHHQTFLRLGEELHSSTNLNRSQPFRLAQLADCFCYIAIPLLPRPLDDALALNTSRLPQTISNQR